MVKPEWGAKHLCENCGAKFYDMLRDPAVCPKCETKVAVPRPRRGKPAGVKPVVVEPPVKAKEDEAVSDDADALLDDNDDDEDVEDDALLADEEEFSTDDIPVVGGIDGDDDKDV